MNTSGMTETTPVLLSRADSKALTRKRILETARRVFEREGFHGASLNQVAREAGFTKGAVYSAFDSKADLFLTLLAARAAARQQAFEAIAGQATSAETFVAEVTGRFARSVAHERGWWAAVIEFATFVARDETLRRRYAEHHDASRQTLARTLQDWSVRTGEQLAIDPLQLATASLALGNGLTLEWLLSPESVPESLYVDANQALHRGAWR